MSSEEDEEDEEGEEEEQVIEYFHSKHRFRFKVTTTVLNI